MLAINIDDVINVLNTCKPYLIALGVILALAVVITIAVKKLPKPKKKLIRAQSWIRISSCICCNCEYDLLGTDVQYDFIGNRKE